MQVYVSFWSGAKALRPEDLGLKPEQIAETYKLGKKMLVPEEVIRNFRRIEGQARRLVEENSHPFPIGNASFVTKRSFAKINKKLAELKAQYMALVDDLIAKYEQYRQEVLPIYLEAANTAFINVTPVVMEGSIDNYDRQGEREVFIEKFMERLNSYYPPVESLRRRFDLYWDIYEVAAPEMREIDAGTVLESEEERAKIVEIARAQMRQKIDGFVSDTVKVLRQETTEICLRIVTAIKEGKVIRSNTVTSLRNFIERFKDMNFVGDKTIESQLDAVQKELLDAHPESTFVDNAELREELGRRLTMVVEEAGKMSEQDINGVTGDYSRKVNWSE
jgi:hypothetical protein